jgi:phosphate transport system substrate-binding protein
MKKLIAVSQVAFLIWLFSLSTSIAVETIHVAGSSTVLPLAEAAAEVFNSEHADIRVSITGGGSGVGIKNIADCISDIGLASREVTADEKIRYGDKFHENLVAYDGIAIAISKAIYDAGVPSLTGIQVKKIYSGEINNWNELGGPDEEIYALAREQGSGTRDTFNEAIMGDKKAETPGVSTVEMSSAGIKTAIVGANNAIGYLGFSYIRDDGAPAIAIDGVMPTAETIKNGSYVLSRKLYFDTFGEPKPAARAFIDFVIGARGQEIVEENGFVPL